MVTTIVRFLLLGKNRKRAIVCAEHTLLDFDNLYVVVGAASHLCQQRCSPHCGLQERPFLSQAPGPPGESQGRGRQISHGLKTPESTNSNCRKRITAG